MAANTDKFKKLTNNFSTTLSSAIVGAGDSSFSPASTTNLPTDTGSVFVVDRVNSSGVATPTLREYMIGVVSGGNVTSLVRGVGNSTAQAHSVGAVVEQVVDQKTINDLMDGLLVDLNQSGQHKQLTDTNGNIILNLVPTASSANYLAASNNVTTKNPQLQAAGSDSNVGVDIVSKGTGVSRIDGAAPKQMFQNGMFNFVESGCVWTGDSYGSTRNASMTSGVVWINGKRLTVASVTARTFTASKDTYVDLQDNGDGTASITYTEVTNNAASPAIPNSQTDATNARIVIVITGASNIANSGSVNQGQLGMLLPIASLVPYSVTDSLGNLIYPRDPLRRFLGGGYRTTNAGPVASTTGADIQTQARVNIPAGRRIKLTAKVQCVLYNNSPKNGGIQIWDGTVGSGTKLDFTLFQISSTSTESGLICVAYVDPPSMTAITNKTYNVGIFSDSDGVSTVQTLASSTGPTTIVAELE